MRHRICRFCSSDLSRFINTDTYLSLQIIQSETHPASHNQGPTKASAGSKEGLSVYGLFHHLARSPQGKYRLRQLFLRPSLDLNLINERLDTISVLLRPANQGILAELGKNLRQVKNMSTVMTNLQKGLGNTGDAVGGVKGSVWRNIRQVSIMFSEDAGPHGIFMDDDISEIVCFQYNEDKGSSK